MGIVNCMRSRGRNRCQISVARTWQLHVVAFCFVRGANTWKSVGPRLPTEFVTDYSARTGRLWTTLATVQISLPVISILLDPLKTSAWQADADGKQAVTCWLQTLDTSYFISGVQGFVPRWDKCLNVSDDSGSLVCTMCYRFNIRVFTLLVETALCLRD
jgi:hypothetical protein